MSTIHIYSTAHPETQTGARAHRVNDEDGGGVHGVDSLTDLKDLFRQLVVVATGASRQRRAGYDVMDFHTHGCPGGIQLGADVLTWNSLQLFRHDHFERIFNQDATVTFSGCNVARDPIGELFLAEFGSIFLREGGGQVRGNTGMGFSTIWGALPGDPVHPLGHWVVARVAVGGGITLSGHTHLNPWTIRDELVHLRAVLRSQGGEILARDGLRASQLIGEAESQLGEGDSFSSYLRLYRAAVATAEARRLVGTSIGTTRLQRWRDEPAMSN